MLIPVSVIVVLTYVVLLFGVALTSGSPPASAEDARARALHWVGTGVAGMPRWDGEGWQVDVRRPNGSLVEVTLDEDLALRELSQELDSGGLGGGHRRGDRCAEPGCYPSR